MAAHSALDHEKRLRLEAEHLMKQQQDEHAQAMAALKVEGQAAAEALQLANEHLANDVRVAREVILECSFAYLKCQYHLDIPPLHVFSCASLFFIVLLRSAAARIMRLRE